MMNTLPKLFLSPVLLLILSSTTALNAQVKDSDLDSYYAFPWSIGPTYSSSNGLDAFASGFRYTDLGTEARVPLPFAPSLQPLIRGGLLTTTQPGTVEQGGWNHSLSYAQLGLGFSHRFSKNLELGIDGSLGGGQTIYPNLVAGGPVGTWDLLGRVSARIALLPSNTFSVELVPDLVMRRTLGPLTEFDGIYYGLGLQVGWRFGDDPDASTQSLRSLRIGQDRLPAAFGAMQGYYSRNPLGTVTITNTESRTVTDLELTFFQPGYMDSPTPIASVRELKPGQSVDVGVKASFNQEVFRTEGMTPLVGQLNARYRVGGRPVEQAQSLSYDLYDKTSVVWDDDRKVGAFITPADSALRNYVSYVRQGLKDEALPQWNAPLQTAAQVWTSLGLQGLIYQADPTSPFTRAQTNTVLVDSINLARQTLSRGTGDCDDLTVLFASLLESAGIETGYITVPGHIFAVLNTKVASQSYRTIHPDRDLTIPVDGALWIPVEITLLGKQGFLEAWKKGAELWHVYDTEPSKRTLTKTQVSQLVFGPVALRESDLGLQYAGKSALTKSYREDLERITDSALSLSVQAAKSGDGRDLNMLGMMYVRFGKLKEAETTFLKASKSDPSLVNPQINLGNLAFLQRDYKKALSLYQAGLKTLDTAGSSNSLVAQQVLVNLSKTYNAMKDFDGAKKSFVKAQGIDPEAVKEFGYLAQVGAGGSGDRAAEQRDGPLFLGD